MRKPTAVVDLDLTHPLTRRTDLERFGDAEVLCRLHGRPLGFVRAAVEHGGVALDQVIREVLDGLVRPAGVALAERAINSGRPPQWPDAAGLLVGAQDAPNAGPLVTVAVCTRDRAENLRPCLDALLALRYEPIDLLVIDNAPATAQTETLIRDHYPSVRYVREPRPGLDWARNRAILECRGDILAFTDDDVLVDPGWISSMVRVFLADPEVMAVTGLVIPHELETDAQRLFEAYGGFGRGFRRRWYRAPLDRPSFALHGGSGKFGTGANMAFWRPLFDHIGGFDPALDVGTPTNGGGDLEMFFRVLKAGHTLVYEPSAIVRHRHRRTYAELRAQIANNGIGFYSYLARTADVLPDETKAVWTFAAWWFYWWSMRRMARALLRKLPIPMDLVVAEAKGSLRGRRRYRPSRRQADRIAATFADQPAMTVAAPAWPNRPLLPEAQRHVELAQPLRPIADATGYDRLRVVVSWDGVPIGSVRIEHHGAVVSALWLSDMIAQQLTVQVLDAHTRLGEKALMAALTAGLARALMPAVESWRRTKDAPDETRPAERLSASIVVATCDRPADLANCLEGLVSQQSRHPFEVVVVDNHPASGITPEVVRRFPSVRLIQEERGGLSYARNAGILAAGGDIIVSTDDDVVVPPDWLDRLLAPFAQSDVMVVCGNVLPLEVETEAQRMFEAYGGLGRGFQRQTVNGEWFARWRRAVPTWELGCTANAAFRAGIFHRTDIGLMDEALGAGTPTGCSEDTYVYYRVLKAGYAIVYEPDAYVWHRHRSSMASLRRQIYAYSKGHVAYQLTTWLRDGDTRALLRLGYELPRVYLRRTIERLRGASDYPLSLVALEVLGTLAGPYALWQSRRRVRRLGRTTRPSSSDAGSESRGRRKIPEAA